MIRVALTHDIDRVKKTYQFITKPLLALRKGDFKHFYTSLSTVFDSDNYWQFNDIIEIEDSYNLRSTFFFLNESIGFDWHNFKTFQLAHGRYDILNERIVEQIQWLDRNNWEIGVHGSYNSFQNLAMLKKEKEILEGIVGHEIYGIRQHYLNLNDETWKIQQNLGFKYDSSFGYTRDVGFKGEKYKPFFPLNNDFMVIPQVLMDMPYMLKKDRRTALDALFNLCDEKGAVLVVNFHNDKFNKKDYPGYRDAYVELIERALDKGAVFKTLQEYYEDFSTK